MARIDGMDRLITRLESLSHVWDDSSVVNAGAAEFVKIQKENVRKKLNKNPRGVLEGALQVIPINSKTAEAGIPLNTIIYALAHEYGVKIYPKKAKALRFEIDGKVIFAGSVTIPARPYVRPSVNHGKGPAVDAIVEITNKRMRELIR
jgi:hypothetical protein